MKTWTDIFPESSSSEEELDPEAEQFAQVAEVATYAISTQDLKPDDPMDFERLKNPWSDKRDRYEAPATPAAAPKPRGALPKRDDKLCRTIADLRDGYVSIVDD